MKQKILDALKTKFEGVQDAILDRIATKLAKTVTSEEEVTTKVEGVTFNDVLTSYGDSRATDAQKTAIANYEKTHGLKNGKKVTKVVDDDGNDDDDNLDDDKDMPKWAKFLMKQNKTLAEQNKALTDRLDASDKNRITNSRKKQFDEAISKLPDNLKKVYGRYSYGSMSDDEFTTLMGEVKTEVEDFEKESKQRSAVFGRPLRGTQNGKTQVSEDDAKAVAEAMHL